ncbi:MAG: hypothetical protein LQ342_002973 [Letrouitia transgressa]|nr:MAG: hypothetical protein LQ342_002973 [Letrouitia transgressa]
MTKKSKLSLALAARQGVDYKLERQKKLQKQATKRKKLKERDHQVNDGQDDIYQDSPAALIETPLQDAKIKPGKDQQVLEKTLELEQDGGLNTGSSSHDSNSDHLEFSDQLEKSTSSGSDNDKELDEREQNADAIPLSDLEDLSDEQREDVLPHQRLTINNSVALTKAYRSIALPVAELSFSENQSVTSTEPILISDINDDLTRELAFYKQCLDAAKEGISLLKKEGVPSTRPADFFAEMVKSDEHMGKIKQKLTDEAARRKAAAEVRKQRDMKKFGKEVQIAKLQERDKAKRDTLDKINLLKRKRKNATGPTTQEDDMFDVAIEDAAKSSNHGTKPNGHAQSKRRKKDSRFGFGGKKRYGKSGDAASTADMRGFSVSKMKGQKKGIQRLGKGRRS